MSRLYSHNNLKEAKEQFDREVLKTDEYYNGIINVRVGSSKALTESLNRHKS